MAEPDGWDTTRSRVHRLLGQLQLSAADELAALAAGAPAGADISAVVGDDRSTSSAVRVGSAARTASPTTPR